MDDGTEQLVEGAADHAVVSSPGSVSQTRPPLCSRFTATAEKPDSERSCTTVWKLREPEGRRDAGIVTLVRGALRSS
jgi:hypothetical protein